ncbi:9396_t:CDS:2 [Paraglomus brasilianum]|uniref:9396_t:CDS:1 n=1 Tax=Paraglomus brasilianum TaxID=144538 RepID=A0A9N9D4P7_9GLOM|nr:9396_t:CDS:2 [Paraglomus brasilianum]
MESKGPIYTSIFNKLSTLSPTNLQIINESHLHAHHQAMQGVSSKETHFRVEVVSKDFEGKSLMQRHRLIYQLLDDELKNGVHALSIKAKTPEEIGD